MFIIIEELKVYYMKKSPKQLFAIIALCLIFVLIICFIISAFTAGSSNLFLIFFALIIAVPIIAWLGLFIYGRFTGKHTIAELFPESWSKADTVNLEKNPDNADFTEEELSQAMENEKNSSSK